MTKLKMNVVRSVEIEPISEEYISELLRKDIEAQLPEGAHVKKIEFQRRLNPQRIEAEVTAFFGSKDLVAEPVKTAEDKVEAIKEVVEETEALVEEVLAADVFAPKAEAEPEQQVSVTPPKIDVASLFG